MSSSPTHIISTPRAPRSTHHRRSSSTRSSPRQNRGNTPYHSPRSPRSPASQLEADLHEPVSPTPSRSRSYANYVGPPTPDVVPENLHQTDDVFNVDPTSGVLDAAGDTYQAEIPPAGRKRFVGGFVGGLKRAWGQRGGAARPDDGFGNEPPIPFPEPAIIHDEETEYTPVPHSERFMSPEQERYASPMPEASTSQYRGVPLETPYEQDEEDLYDDEERPGHERQESSASTATMHQTQEHYEGTTIVNHEPLPPPPQQYASPRFSEPPLDPEYGKMASEARSEAPLGYIARFQRFLKAINDLPWVSPDRVTVDYIPAGAREQMALEEAMNSTIGSPRPRPRSRARSGVSRRSSTWYMSNPSQSMFITSTPRPPLPTDEFGQPMMPKDIPMAFSPQQPTVTTQYPYMSPGEESELVYRPLEPKTPPRTPPKPLAGALGFNTPRAGTSRRVPPPRYSPDFDGPPGSGTYRPPGSPRYAMGGYVPYEQQPNQTYTASTMSSVAPSVRG